MVTQQNTTRFSATNFADPFSDECIDLSLFRWNFLAKIQVFALRMIPYRKYISQRNYFQLQIIYVDFAPSILNVSISGKSFFSWLQTPSIHGRARSPFYYKPVSGENTVDNSVATCALHLIESHRFQMNLIPKRKSIRTPSCPNEKTPFLTKCVMVTKFVLS